MTGPARGVSTGLAADGRPTETIPTSQLLRMTLYWFGLSSIFIAVDTILGGRLEYQGLVAPGEEVSDEEFKVRLGTQQEMLESLNERAHG